MSVFVQKFNPITGTNDWIVQEEDYDYHQEVARAAFADMLHDTERNQKYEAALKSAIEIMHSKGKQANVLDIGTGTGLLSMMAVRHGADSVTACEAFQPMSTCALKIIERNGFAQKIKLIPKRSTGLTVGAGGDLEARCNILVTEVFDTELIGEGALGTFSHAYEALLEKDCIVVPQSATIFAHVVECPFVQNWNKVKNVFDDEGKLLLEVPPKIAQCAGSASVHDLQLNQIKSDLFKTIVPPIPVFNFDWSGRTPLVFEQSTINTVKSQRTGKAQAVFMWWDLQMDTESQIILSCAPYWAHPLRTNNPKVLPWRDHWMQAIYYLPKEIQVEENMELNLISCHDEFSLWFSLTTDLKLTEVDSVKPICECGLHVAFSRSRIGQINDSTRNKKYLNLLTSNIDSSSVVLILSDGFYLSLCASKMGANKIYTIESNHLSRQILLEFIKFNKIENVEVFPNVEALQQAPGLEKISLVFGEPYFINTILPWDNLLFLYQLKAVKPLLTTDAKIFPELARIKGVAVSFADLNKIRQPLGACEGFRMKEFDDLIEMSSSISDDNVEVQPLWEYPGIALSDVIEIASINLADCQENSIETRGVFEIDRKYGSCNGIALWVEWVHEKNTRNSISTGPISMPEIGQYIDWDIYTRQGVCLFSNKDVSQLKYSFKFEIREGNVTFKCI